MKNLLYLFAILFAGTLFAIEEGLEKTNPLAAMPTGYTYLSTVACQPGYTAKESGYMKLGNQSAIDSNNLTPTSRNLATPGHYHSEGGAGAGLTANNSTTGLLNHRHGDGSYVSNMYHGNFYEGPNTNPYYDLMYYQNTPTGTKDVSGWSSFTDLRNHTHPISGTVGKVTGGENGDIGIIPVGDMEHIVLRLCVKD